MFKLLWSRPKQRIQIHSFHPKQHTHTTILRPSWILSRTTQVSRHQKGKNKSKR